MNAKHARFIVDHIAPKFGIYIYSTNELNNLGVKMVLERMPGSVHPFPNRLEQILGDEFRIVSREAHIQINELYRNFVEAALKAAEKVRWDLAYEGGHPLQ